MTRARDLAAFVSNADGDIKFDTDTLFIDSSANRVGIGTNTPSRQMSITDDTNPFLQLALSSDDAANNGLEIVMDANGAYFQNRENTPSIFSTNNTERMRIDSSGRLLIDGSGTVDSSNGAYIDLRGGDNTNINTYRIGTGGRAHLAFYNGTSASRSLVGSITTSGSSTSFNTSSDYRLKENVTDLTSAITRVKSLQPKRFNFIADDSTTLDGFLAHEAQTVVPEAVYGTHNEVDDDNNPVYQGIDQSKLVPLLTAALQEAITKIETLETENTAIKARLDALEAE